MRSSDELGDVAVERGRVPLQILDEEFCSARLDAPHLQACGVELLSQVLAAHLAEDAKLLNPFVCGLRFYSSSSFRHADVVANFATPCKHVARIET